MARTYDQMVTLVRDWSNRDVEALPNEIIMDSLRWAADKAYRTLRVPPLEKTLYYTAEQLRDATSSTNNRQASVTSLGIPADLIEFIHIRGVDADYRTTRMFNEKADIRTFWDLNAEKYSDLAVFSRQGTQVLIAPGYGISPNYGTLGVQQEDGIEIFYYGRLPALNATYDVSADNFNALLFSSVDTNAIPVVGSNNAFLEKVATPTDNSIAMGTGRLWVVDYTPVDPTSTNMPFVQAFASEDLANAAADSPPVGFNGQAAPQDFRGLEAPHWLRDENERILLMGALAECFFYLQENDEAQKYAALFASEIAELNNEDVMRNASGGNVQVNFNGRGLI